MRIPVFIAAALLASAPIASDAQGAPLRPGDRILVTLRDTSDIATVRHDGRVVLPIVGTLSLVGLAPAAAEDSITRAYAAFTRRPDIRVSALRRITVQGAVRRADVLYLDATSGLAEALAMAGGVSETGHLGKVDLFRNGQSVGRYDARTPATTGVALESGDLILVGERSWWSRNPGVIVSIVSSLLTVAVVLAQ
ncbi:MAG: polysaccharide biosynthesis/export family protein [Gemmatimonadaceae bacterium]|nr:polysaccharide biosynthesis/export family protein [Gemmatimonadaceae bacterium]MCW5825402.1 polysaccharide biosynthesis/export family protein [Gemmatimonadaceae bacterium]